MYEQNQTFYFFTNLNSLRDKESIKIYRKLWNRQQENRQISALVGQEACRQGKIDDFERRSKQRDKYLQIFLILCLLDRASS